MKKITAYVNTERVRQLVVEIEAAGIREIMVTEYFSPSSQISRMELLAENTLVERIRGLVHKEGSRGEPGDHCSFVEDFDPGLPGMIPIGKRSSRLEESRVKQLVSFLLGGSHRQIRLAFSAVAVGVVGVSMFVQFQMSAVRRSTEETSDFVRLVSQATGDVRHAALEEMLAAERYHQGEAAIALEDFQGARGKLMSAISVLRESGAIERRLIDSLTVNEQRFHLVAGAMFGSLDGLSRRARSVGQSSIDGLSSSHQATMSALNRIRLELLSLLSWLEKETAAHTREKQESQDALIVDAKLLLLALAAGAVVLTVIIWFVIERKVSRPIRKLVDESRTIDTNVLR